MSRVRNNPHFFKQAFERTSHFLPNTNMLLKRKRGRKPRRNFLITASDQSSLLWVAVPETISNLRCLIKHSWMVRGSVEKGHLFWKNKTKLQENRSVELGSSKRTSSEKISATQSIYLLWIPRPRCTCIAPIRMIGTMLAATSVGQLSKSTGTRSGRYRPNHGKIFVDRL